MSPSLGALEVFTAASVCEETAKGDAFRSDGQFLGPLVLGGLSRRSVIKAAVASPGVSVPTDGATWRLQGSRPTTAPASEASALDGSLKLQRRNAFFCLLASSLVPTFDGFFGENAPALARERRQKTDFPIEEYQEQENGLSVLDVEEGTGREPADGDLVKVHFEVRYRNLVVVSTRESKLLGGNRSISQVYEFTLGAPPGAERRRDATETANGLYSAQAAPRPPKALYSAVRGMRAGGKRSVIVPPELAYGSRGYNEIPPGATVKLNIDLLDVAKPASL